MLLRTGFTLAILCISLMVQSQNIIYSYTYDIDEEGWQTQSISNSGFWAWAPNGLADQGTYWNARPPVGGSDNGALVFDGDHMINSNQGNITLPYSTGMMSPLLDFSAYPSVFIKFDQYYRNYDAQTFVEVSNDSGSTWTSIEVNEDVNRNVETPNTDYKIIDISAVAANQATVNVRFLFEGQYYYWLIDNVEFLDGYPVIPTFPAYVGEYLTLHGYPYLVDDKGWPYIPNEAVVNFAPGTPEIVKAQLRDEVGAVIKETCVCNTLETWTFLDSLLEGAIGLSSNGLTTGADEQISTSTSASEIDDIDFNKYVKGELSVGSFLPPDIDDIVDLQQRPKGNEPLKIAIIDTGVDILHRHLDDYIHLSEDIPYNQEDDDENCYPDNYVGWNFVDDNNNASDDHGHGTHVAGIIADAFGELKKKSKVQLIPYKTHDAKGLASLFAVTCAMYQSVRDEVSVVNCSWGFYGNESEVLKTAISVANEKKITVVAATGNDSLNLYEHQQFPACYKLPNMISVGSYNIEEEHQDVINSLFSNYGAKFVDVLAPGVNIYSTVPPNAFAFKTGTSMAAPYVAGLAANKYLSGYTDPSVIKFTILNEAQHYNHLASYVRSGNVLIESDSDSDTFVQDGMEFQDDSSDEGIAIREDLTWFETDVIIKKYDQQITLEFGAEYRDVNIYIANAQGQLMVAKKLNNVNEGFVEYIDIDRLSQGLYFLRVNEKVFEFAVY